VILEQWIQTLFFSLICLFNELNETQIKYSIKTDKNMTSVMIDARHLGNFK